MTPEIATGIAFASAIALRHVLQLWLTRSKVGGSRSGWTSTSLLFVSYVSAMMICLYRIAFSDVSLRAIAAGLIVWALAVSLRMWALDHLREQFSSLIELRDDHRLVTSGPYAIVRHPLHLAFGLEVTAFAFGAWSWLAIPSVVLVWVTIAVRNRTEDVALAEHFGRGDEDAYCAYCRRVPGMNPVVGIFRLITSSR